VQQVANRCCEREYHVAAEELAALPLEKASLPQKTVQRVVRRAGIQPDGEGEEHVRFGEVSAATVAPALLDLPADEVAEAVQRPPAASFREIVLSQHSWPSETLRRSSKVTKYKTHTRTFSSVYMT